MSDDEELWADFTRDIAPIKREKPAAPAQKTRKPKKLAPQSKPQALQSELTVRPDIPKAPAQPHGAGLDRRSAEKLRKGQMPIDARLDLHGMTQDRAHHALDDFIKRTHGAGHRCVLVITGKGKSGKRADEYWSGGDGVLKQKVPQWLGAAPLSSMILKTQIARPKDGGDGALYILLRRRR